MGGIFVSFILPQAIALINKPGPVSQEALERVFLMSCLCAAMCWFGYQLPPSRNLIKKLDLAIDTKKLFQGGIVFVLIGYVSYFLIMRQPEAARENTQWTGIITIYAFFSTLIYPGLTILLSSTLRHPTISKLILTAFAAALPLHTIILYGRREPTATFILTIGLSLYFIRKLVPPRWLVISFVVIALFAIPLTGTYRAIAKTGDWSQLQEIQPLETLENFVKNQEILELKNAALLMDAAVRTNQYGYGIEYWNSLIFRFVPAQLVGANFKKLLQIELANYDLETLYRYKMTTGITITGIGDAFTQFDYMGCLFFFCLAWFFKTLWFSANYKNSITSQIFYVSLFSPSMLSVTHGTVGFIPDFVFNLIFLSLVIIYASRKPMYKGLNVSVDNMLEKQIKY
ncbi:MAG: hypothetical protein KME25_11390 [Symplocastrum torsivum CPER-KK1]|jgi:hypothetical protein|uniref:Oligosaccharide repeat unit polymerase n=1 Tax=Symplocastrum torsivum CPER-KK1 TaxID=450513 RepID=A0A951PLB2_9CYAN|nr:hypothetical protein [Symplocastrum torsivum CPER-KK1]